MAFIKKQKRDPSLRILGAKSTAFWSEEITQKDWENVRLDEENTKLNFWHWHWPSALNQATCADSLHKSSQCVSSNTHFDKEAKGDN